MASPPRKPATPADQARLGKSAHGVSGAGPGLAKRTAIEYSTRAYVLLALLEGRAVKEDRIEDAARESRIESYVAELRRPATVVALPGPASAARCELLAETALELARAGEGGRARRAVLDARQMGTSLLEGGHDKRVAGAMIMAGDTFVLLSEMVLAAECFTLAAVAYDGLRSLLGAARARFGLATALRELGDPRARPVLEDAGELYEEIGDQVSAHAIDRLLREMQADFEESPESFHSSSRILRVSREQT